MEKYSNEIGKSINKLSSYALDLLSRYDFPGNVRELENMIERSVALSTTKLYCLKAWLSLYRKGVVKESRPRLEVTPAGINLDEVLAEIEKGGYITSALEITGGSKQKSAELLGIRLRSLRYRMEKLGIGDKGSETRDR